MKKLIVYIFVSLLLLLGCETTRYENDNSNKNSYDDYQKISRTIPIYITLSASKDTENQVNSIRLRSSEINLYQINHEDLLSGVFSDGSGSEIFLDMQENHPYNLQFTSGKKMIMMQSISPLTNAPINLIQFNIGYGQFWYFTEDEEIEPESEYLPNGDLQGNSIYFIDKQALQEPFYVTRIEFGDSKEDTGLVLDRTIPDYISRVMESVKRDPFEGGGALFIPFDPIQTDWIDEAYELLISIDLEYILKSSSALNEHIAGTPLDISISFREVNDDTIDTDIHEGEWILQPLK